MNVFFVFIVQPRGYHEGVAKDGIKSLHSVLRDFMSSQLSIFAKQVFIPVTEAENGWCWVWMHAGTLSKRQRGCGPSQPNVSSRRVINDQCCIWVSLSDFQGSLLVTYSSQLLPLTAASSSSVIRCPVVKYPAKPPQSALSLTGCPLMWGLQERN